MASIAATVARKKRSVLRVGRDVWKTPEYASLLPGYVCGLIFMGKKS
jgi:hypothetical protein